MLNVRGCVVMLSVRGCVVMVRLGTRDSNFSRLVIELLTFFKETYLSVFGPPRLNLNFQTLNPEHRTGLNLTNQPPVS